MHLCANTVHWLIAYSVSTYSCATCYHQYRLCITVDASASASNMTVAYRALRICLCLFLLAPFLYVGVIDGPQYTYIGTDLDLVGTAIFSGNVQPELGKRNELETTYI